MDNDDNQSVGSSSSTSSVSNTKVSCPYCVTTIVGKYMFKHIYEKHYNELITNTTKEALDDILPTRVHFS